MSTVPLIAIVEDDKAMRQALADLIEVLDFACVTFDGSESFLAAFAPGRFSCLVTDLNLKGESGLQLQQRLRQVEPALPVIVISAQTDPAIRATILQAGALAYLTKPVDDHVLLRHLVSAMGRSPPDAADGPD